MKTAAKMVCAYASLLAASMAVTASCADEQAAALGGPALIDISPDAPPDITHQPVNDYAFLQVIAGDKPSYGSRRDFESADGKLQVDYSEYTPMTLKLANWPADEFMLFVEGQVEITDDQGRGKVYGPGDMILMPRGFNGTWRQLGPIRKISVTYDWREQ